MIYTNFQVASWTEQLNKSCKSLNLTNTETQQLLVKHFLKQITYGASVKLHRNCVLSREECDTRRQQREECTLFKFSRFDDMEYSKKKVKTTKTASNGKQNKLLQGDAGNASDLEEQDNSLKCITNNTEVNTTSSFLDASTSGIINSPRDEALIGHCSIKGNDKILDSTLKAEPKKLLSESICNNELSMNSMQSILSDSLVGNSVENTAIKQKYSKTYIAEETPIKSKSRKRKSRAKAKSQKVNESKSTLQCEKSFIKKFQEGLTFQDLLGLVTSTDDNETLKRENDIGENDFIKIEPNDIEEGDKIVIKLPRCMNRTTTIDLTTSENIFQMMFLPVLVDEKQRFYEKNRLFDVAQKNTVSPPNVQKIYASLHMTQPCVVPDSSSIKQTENILGTKNKKRKINSKTFTNKRGFTLLKSSTQPLPVRVTSSNGYDKTHFVDLPMQGPENANSTDLTLTLNSNECQNQILNEISTEFKKRGRPAKIQAIKSIEDLSKIAVKEPKKRQKKSKNPNAKIKKSKITKKSSNQRNTQCRKSCNRVQEEATLKNNVSFLAGLDMPLINEETTNENMLFGSQAFEKQILDYNSGDNQSKMYPTISSSTLSGNHNIQASYSTNDIFTSSQTVTAFSTLENASIQNTANDLLERFYIGEVGEVVGNEIEIRLSDSDALIQTEEHQLTNPCINTEGADKILQDDINYNSSTEPLVTIMGFGGDQLSFLDNMVSYDTNQKNTYASYANSSNYTNNSYSSVIDSYNQENVACASRPVSNSFLNNFTSNNNLLIEKVNNSLYAEAKLTSKKALCFNNNCCSAEYCKSFQENFLDKTTMTRCLRPSQEQMKDSGNMLSNHPFTNYNNIFVDHTYSMHFKKLPQCKKIQPSVEETKTIQNTYQMNLDDTNVWGQSEHKQSEIETVPDEESLQTPPLRIVGENRSSFYCSEKSLQNMSCSLARNNDGSSLMKDQKSASKKESGELKNKNDFRMSVQVEKMANLSKSTLQESDLFLPPLELESKLNNDVLDFDCGSEMSFENSNNSFSKKDNESSSNTSIKYQSSHDNALTMTGGNIQVISNEIISPCLEDKTEDLGDFGKNNFFRNTFNQTSPIDNIAYCSKQNNIEKEFSLKQIASRRKSETSFVNRQPNRLPSRMSIDTMPAYLSQFKIPKLNDSKQTKIAINLANTNSNMRQHLQPKVPNLQINKNVELLKNKSPNAEVPNNAQYGSSFSNMGSLGDILKVLIQNSSLSEMVPQLTEMILSSVANQNQNNEKNSKFDNQSDQFKSTSRKKPDQEKTSSFQTFADIAKFFNITCFPYLSDRCSNTNFCQFSHILRDVGWIRIELRLLSSDDVNILYKFIYRHKKLYSNYFDVFCYYYTENRKTNSLCRMLIDCQRYLNLSEKKFVVIYNCLMDCGLNKQTACGYVLKNLRRRTSECLNAIMYIIVESDWTLFVNHVREIISDPNIVLSIKTLEKMAQSFIKNPNDRILVLFWHCIFKIDATEMNQIQGNPALRMIIQKYNFFPSGIQEFCVGSNGPFGNHNENNSGLFKC